MRKLVVASVLALVAGSAHAADAPPRSDLPVESLGDAVAEALKQNPDIQIAYARRDDAKWGIAEARAATLPRVDASAGIGPNLNGDGPNGEHRDRHYEASITGHQTLFDFGLTPNDIRRARAAYESADWAARGQIETVSLQIAEAYLTMLERQRLVDLAEAEIGEHQHILKMVDTQRGLGLVTGADVNRVQSRLDGVRSQLLDRRSELDQARESFRRLLGRAPQRVVDVPAPDAALPVDADAAAAMVADHNPRLMEAELERKSIERQLASHKGNFYPRLGLEAQASYRDDVLVDINRRRDYRAVAVINYNLFNGGADRAVEKRIQARVTEAGFQVDKARREADQDVRNDFSALRAAREKVATIDSELGAAQRVADSYVDQFKSGSRTAFDLLDSQQSLFASRANRITNGTRLTLQGFRVLERLGLLFETLTGTTPAGASRQ